MTHHFTAASYGEKSLSLASASDEIVITWFGHFVILAPKHGALPGSLFPWSLLCFYNYPKWRNDCLKYFFSCLLSVPLEGLKSQGAFEEMRQNYIRELTKAVHGREKGLVASSQRFYHLTKLMDAMHEVGAM